jgi:hypothetical protein
VTEEDHEFIVETLVRADRANVGWTSKETANNLVCLTEATDRPLSEQQAENYVYHTLRNDKRVKNKLVTAQKTTSKHSMTSVAHQWCWMLNIKQALDFLHRMNTGVCRVTGKTFGELIDYFAAGADEACLMADQHGNVKIIGAADKKKHKRKVGENQCSITMFCLGVTVGHNGPILLSL